ncbi:acylneuraminate cytidylyltransferase family protein [Sphingobacterium hotanense]|uniref:acylneuraminate cytidylyltransferase family protein n=1 Tax=Sphingobacterium hotanense TaxID=649196 RepID=UPI0021A85873|nr:hypothetical protein [Sphingobacterium hotanense]MCT1526944.1 hypothetical protein [Sphingobacterium hotanense]
MISHESIAFFLPTRRNSERVANKNTRNFAGIEGGLLRVKLDQLLSVPEIPIYLSTNDPESIAIAGGYDNPRIKIIERPEKLCLSTTNLQDLIDYVPSIIEESHIMWVHVTSPMVDSNDYQIAISHYFENLSSGSFDSLMSVVKLQEYFWSKELNNLINHDRSKIKWPRTQDLNALYEINHAIFLSSKENYLTFHDRIGEFPFLFEMNKMKSIDIDWEDDFKLAEFIYENVR